MSSKRISLTVSDEVYEAIQTCKESNGWTTDAGMVLSLIIWQLRELGYLYMPLPNDDDL